MSNKRVLLPSFALLAALVLPQNLQAYDSERLQAALESLGPTTLARWESKARGGDALAQNVTGMAYKYGIGTEQNHAVSLEWFRKAADQGDADAQFNLARIYGKAIGTYATTRAAPQDDVKAVKKLARYAAQMTTTQVDNARRLVADWKRRRGSK